MTESSEAELVIDDYTINEHRHTAAVAPARAGMPLHLLQRQVGHANTQQTMKYARFHPDYSDVSAYFERVGKRFGVLASKPEASREGKVASAAELLEIEPEALSRLLAEAGPA